MLIRPIGVVHSPVTSTKNMPHEGSTAIVEVFPEYEDGLLSIEDNSHIVVVCWMNKANRRALRLDRVGPENMPLHKGVFSLRSPSRPNPLGITSARLLRVEGRKLFLDRLDAIDRTPVIDIKAYSIGWDAIFSATSFWDTLPAPNRDPQLMLELIRAQSVNFHGRSCRGLLLGVKMIYDLAMRWGIAPRDPALRFELGDDGCLSDAIQGATGATLGNGRLIWTTGVSPTAILGKRALSYHPRANDEIDGEGLLKADASSLFEIMEMAVVPAAVDERRRWGCGG